MNSPTELPLSQLKRARISVMVIFFINGAVLASLFPHIPYIQQKHQLTEGTLGLTLLSVSIGAILTLIFTGWLISHFGSKITTRFASFLICLALPLPILADNYIALLISFALIGASNGLMDVSMNTQAVSVEKGIRKPIMSSFHAFFSLGGLIGASLCALALKSGMTPTQHVIVVAIIAAIGVLISIINLISSNYDGATQKTVFTLPKGALLILSLLGLGAMLSEGAIGDWSAVYMRNNLETTASLAALGYAAYSLTMTIGRITGDKLRTWLGSVRLVRISGMIAAAGLGIGLLLNHPIAAIIGFACAGLGLSNIVPIVFSAAGNVPGVNAGTGIAAVASIGYIGGLAGPPLLGLTAEWISLPWALGILVIIMAVIAIFAGQIQISAEQSTN
ncbi:MAG: MFS transporter [Anaerolineaceae bacterium]|nr:MFS transporter [Anaerolineaceae bacterium]